MPRTCLACASPKRNEIDKALASGTPYRNISKRFRIGVASLHRHRAHIAQAIVKATERREKSIGESVLERLENLYKRAEKNLFDAEFDRDGRVGLAAIRELRETLAGLFSLAERATAKPAESTAPPDADMYLEAIAKALGAGPLEPIGDPSAVPPPVSLTNPQNLGDLPDLPEPPGPPQQTEPQIYTHVPGQPLTPAIAGVTRQPFRTYDPIEWRER
jgi:hypothetical protein